MKTTNFAKHLSSFLTVYMAEERGYSPNTIKTYRDTFVLFLSYMLEYKKVKIEKLELASITKNTVTDFLDWLEKDENVLLQPEIIGLQRYIRLSNMYSMIIQIIFMNFKVF